MQHAPVLAHYETIQVPNSSIVCLVDQPVSQLHSHPATPPAVLDEGCVLGPLFARFTIVVHDRDNFVRVFGIQRDEREVVLTIHIGEVLRLLFRELFY